MPARLPLHCTLYAFLMDISRFFRSLPNWETVSIATAEADSEEPQEIEKRNEKETDMLVENLGTSDIPAHEILSDPGQLR